MAATNMSGGCSLVIQAVPAGLLMVGCACASMDLIAFSTAFSQCAQVIPATVSVMVVISAFNAMTTHPIGVCSHASSIRVEQLRF
jgi:hypothetical protein